MMVGRKETMMVELKGRTLVVQMAGGMVYKMVVQLVVCLDDLLAVMLAE